MCLHFQKIPNSEVVKKIPIFFLCLENGKFVLIMVAY